MVKRMLTSAIRYARAGLPVFALATGAKVPIKDSRGSLGATVDESILRKLWSVDSDRNVSVRTGKQFDLMVLDIDSGHGGILSIVSLQKKHGRLPATPIVSTPSGGWHLWFRWPGTNLDIRNSVGRVGPGLDIRANGGSIVAPPSIIRNKGTYRWVNGEPGLPGDLAEPPEWLWRLALRPPLPFVEPSGPVRCESAYAKAVLDRELAALAQARPGRRNNALNTSAWRVGRLVRAGMVAESEAMDVLVSQATGIGLPQREAIATIISAFRSAPAKVVA